METPVSRFNLSVILAACIVAAGLVSAARIVAPRNAVSSQSVESARPAAPPPISQESVREQVRAQILAAPILHTFSTKTNYTLIDVKVTQVVYDAKGDVFTVQFDWVWQPEMSAGGPKSDSVTLSNNGYNQYVGPVVLSPIVDGAGQYADICIK